MSLTVIRRNQLGNNKNHSFLLISDTNGEKKNVPYDSLVAALRNKAVDITNLTLTSQGLLKGSNGDLSRYPLVRFNSLDDIVNNKPFASIVENGYNFTILGHCSDGAYKITNLMGTIIEATDAEIINMCSQYNASIANASIVENKFIRPISGQFKQFGPSKRAEELKKRAEAFNKAKAHQQQAYQEFKSEVEGYKKDADRKDIEIKKRDANLRSTYSVKNDTAINVQGQEVKVDTETAEKYRKMQREALLRGNITGKSMPKITKDDYKAGDYDALEGNSAIAKTSFHGMNDSRNGKISIEAKIMLAATTLKAIDPFVYAAYLELKQVLLAEPAAGIRTMAVSDDKLYIVQTTVEKLELPQISWILLHEISHIINRHLVRRGNRDPYLFNVACDLFINKMIADEFGCKPGVPVRKMLYNNVAPIGLEFHLEMDDENQTYTTSLYSENINSKTDTVETIYEQMLEENKQKLEKQQQRQSNSNNNKDKKDNQNGQDGQGNGSDDNKDKKDGSSSEQSGSSDKDGKDNQNGQDGQGNGSNDKSSKSNSSSSEQSGSESYSKSDSSSGQSGQDGTEQAGGGLDGSNGKEKSDPFESYITYKGEPVASLPGDDNKGDMYEDDDTDSHGNSPESRDEWANAFLKRIIQRSKSFNKNGNSAMLRMAEEALMEDFVWTNFVKQYLTKLAGIDYSYSKPSRKGYNRPYFTKGKIGNERLKEEAVYVCIDVSGSITDQDLYKAFEYIRVLLRKLDIQGYVMFWSTVVDEPKEFKNAQDLLLIRKEKYKSTGGTNPDCVFEYFKSAKCRNKPNLVIMITDGYFTIPPRELKPRCETLWIITDKTHNYRTFKPFFGKVAPLIPKV